MCIGAQFKCVNVVFACKDAVVSVAWCYDDQN